MSKRVIDRLRQSVREEKYVISGHANEEMSDDDLTSLDIEHAILTGGIASRLTKDPRGARYEVVGESLDGRDVAILCRMLSTGWLRIITVFALGSDDL